MPISPSLLNRPGRVGVGNAKKDRGEEKDGRGAASPTHSMKKLGKSRHHGAIVMKIDTEGAEYRLLPHLLKEEAACHVDLMFLEWHPTLDRRTSRPTPTQEETRVRKHAQKALGACGTVVSDIDDETFLYDGRPLPAPHSLCGVAM